MIHIITSVSRFSLILLFALYTYDCFAALRPGISRKTKDAFFSLQTSILLLILYNAHVVIYLNTEDILVLLMCIFETGLIFAIMLVFKQLYKGGDFLIVNNMCMLLTVGFIIQTRLNVNLAIRQFVLACIGLLITALIPLLIEKLTFLNRLSFVYAAVGLVGLLAVRLFGKSEYGANLSLRIFGISLQPNEFIKIIFVFFVSSVLYKSKELIDIVFATAVAALHVFILVLSRDLGAGLIFLLTYLTMLYVATGSRRLLLLGIGSSALASVFAYFLFSHVRVRVKAWSDPLSVIDTGGYQVSQSLFAIGTGGWFGSGLTKGLPETIPVVNEDFVFSAICEEMGAVFGLCLIFVCISSFLMFMNAALTIKSDFYKLVAVGLSAVYGFQVLVSVGGVIKMIPSTGITLPLISYGGSSLISTMALFAIIEGLYCLKHKENYEGQAD